MLVGGYIPQGVHASFIDAAQRPLNPLEDIRFVVSRLSQTYTLPGKGRPLLFRHYDFQACQPDILSLPLNVDVMSQPVSAWNTGKA